MAATEEDGAKKFIDTEAACSNFRNGEGESGTDEYESTSEEQDDVSLGGMSCPFGLEENISDDMEDDQVADWLVGT